MRTRILAWILARVFALTTASGNQQAETSTIVDDAIVKMTKMTLDGPRGNRAKDKMPIYDGEDLAPSSKIRKTSH